MTKDKLVAELQRRFDDEFVGTSFNFSQYIQDNVEEGLSGIKGANSVKIIGPDLDVLEQLASQIAAQMRPVRGIQDLGIFHVLGQPNLNITVDRARAARYGLNSGDVTTLVQAAMGGTQATTVLEGGSAVRPHGAIPGRVSRRSRVGAAFDGGLPELRGRRVLHSATGAGDYLLGHRRLLHLSRA